MTMDTGRWDGIDALVSDIQARVRSGSALGVVGMLSELRGEIAAARFEAEQGACECGSVSDPAPPAPPAPSARPLPPVSPAVAGLPGDPNLGRVDADGKFTTAAAPARAPDPRLYGFTGNICWNCGGAHLIRSGTCEKCNDCGETTGCS